MPNRRRICLDVEFFVPYKGAIITAEDLARSEAGLLHILDAMVKVNRDWLISHPETPRLYESGVRYKRELKRPGGPENFRDIPHTLRRKSGDCDDLAPWLCAERQVYDGIDAWPDLSGVQLGNQFLYHVRCRWPDGTIEDPSRVLGMEPRKVA